MHCGFKKPLLIEERDRDRYRRLMRAMREQALSIESGAVAARMTIVIPSYQRAALLRRLLRSIADASQSVDSQALQVIVVLDGSTDESTTMLESLQPEFPVPLRFVWQQNRGLAAARNVGVDHVDTESLWLLDDDMVVSAEALQRHLHHDRTHAAVLMGPCNVHSDDPDIVHASWWYEDRHRRLAKDGVIRNPRDSSFANTSSPTELLAKHRFDERFRGYGIEDYELTVRLHAAGETIAFDLAAVVTHDFCPSRAESLRKLREEGANRVRFLAMHPSLPEVVFRSDPGRVERLLRSAARPPAGGLLWGLSRFTETTASLRPLRRLRPRLLGYADLAAIYSGVAAERSKR
jgi:GT2 family glycosyltransferase